MQKPTTMIYVSGVLIGVAIGIAACAVYHDLTVPAHADWVQDYYAGQSADALSNMRLDNEMRILEERQERAYQHEKNPC